MRSKLLFSFCWHNEISKFFYCRWTLELPLYDERFTGYGMNKISHVIELALLGQVTLSLDFILSSVHAQSFHPFKSFKTLSQQYAVRLDFTLGNFLSCAAVGRTLSKLALLAIDKHLYHARINSLLSHGFPFPISNLETLETRLTCI